jgi:hypothetical protein
MSEINSIANGTYVIGQTSATNFVGGPGIKVDSPSEGVVRISNDETVLYSGKASLSNISLNEAITGFAYINFEYAPLDSTVQSEFTYNKLIKTISTDSILVNKQLYLAEWFPNGYAVNQLVNRTVTYSINDAATQLSYRAGWQIFYRDGAWSTRALNTGEFPIYKVIGINRISGGNV